LISKKNNSDYSKKSGMCQVFLKKIKKFSDFT
jgi:hypothetical protein